MVVIVGRGGGIIVRGWVGEEVAKDSGDELWRIDKRGEDESMGLFVVLVTAGARQLVRI